MTTIKTRHFRIRGRVQGVGFRYATRQKAQRLGLSGWVRNCPDNSVEARATGIVASLDALEQWLHHGPPGANVTQVEAGMLNADAPTMKPDLPGFEVLR